MKSLLLAGAILAGSTPLIAQGSRATSAGSWQLVEEARIGPDAVDFGEIRGLVATPAGNIFVLDYQSHEIKMFDAKGKFVRNVARDGGGPGEVRDANGLGVAPDGKLWVHDPANGRFTIYSPNGEYVRTVSAAISGYGYLWEGVVDDKGRAIDPIAKYDAATKKYVYGFVRIIQPDGKADTIAMPTCKGPPQPAVASFSFRSDKGGMMTAVPFVPRSQTVMTRKGTLWCTPSHEYRLSVGPIGQPLKEVVVRAVPPVPVSGDERAASIARIDSATKKYGPPQQGSISDIPKVKPVIARIIADDDGNVWVRRTDTPEKHPAYDVYNDTGKLIASVQSPGPVGYQAFIAKGILLTVVQDEDGIETVVRYRIQRTKG